MLPRSHYSSLSTVCLLILAACSATEEQYSEAEQAISCGDAPQWVAGTAYAVGAQVKNAGRRFSCKVSGWCQQEGPYEPGRGWAAADAWQDLGACDSGTGGTGGTGGGTTGGSGGTTGGSGGTTGGSGGTGGTSSSCSDLPKWKLGTYSGSAEVQNAGGVYVCNPGPSSGWCGQSTAYEPGVGWAWRDAWSFVRSCSDGSGGTGGSGGSAGSGGSGGSGGSPTRVCVDEPSSEVFCGNTCKSIASNGPAANRVALTMMGDGFTQSEIESKFAPHAEAFRRHMFEDAIESEPYVRYRKFINLYRIDLVSNQSGIDNLTDGIYVDTALDGEDGCSDLSAGICQVNWEKAHNAFENALAGSQVARPDWRMIALNSPEFCGATHYPARGPLNVYCPFRSSSLDVALHEGGHAWHLLGDTYWTNELTHPGPEPIHVNLTLDPTGAKWSHWLGYEDPILGTIGVYEGGDQYRRGVYRPSDFQKMGGPPGDVFCHEPGPPYCPHDAVSREKIILDIYSRVRPFDSHTPNSTELRNPQKLVVDVVDCSVVKVDWYVDGTRVAENFGEEFVPAQFGVKPGTHAIEARAYDDTEWVRLDRTSLQQTVRWNVRID